MAANSERPDMEAPAPVNGGMRWRSDYHDRLERYGRPPKYIHASPVELPEKAPRERDAGAVLAPRIAGTPPTEARMGEPYVYYARAFDCAVDGFTWYFEKNTPGMAVDRHTGKVTWTPSEGGYVEVVLCARSLYGAASRQTWTICVHKPAPARSPVINHRFREALRRKATDKRQPFRVFRSIKPRNIDTHWRAAAPPGGRPRVAMPLRV